MLRMVEPGEAPQIQAGRKFCLCETLTMQSMVLRVDQHAVGDFHPPLHTRGKLFAVRHHH